MRNAQKTTLINIRPFCPLFAETRPGWGILLSRRADRHFGLIFTLEGRFLMFEVSGRSSRFRCEIKTSTHKLLQPSFDVIKITRQKTAIKKRDREREKKKNKTLVILKNQRTHVPGHFEDAGCTNSGKR
ncbi:hypothetical protein L798_03823 [Zootermopsis nevadensis]|uniref:Uncharacterized protein n=1 Tax=Zootermopsis nevadensis TaxID=136037 RepID=A0A067RFA9_ZOONE|nr:hypothetical protein L798_03823 [Zootermopsis nevadensis]